MNNNLMADLGDQLSGISQAAGGDQLAHLNPEWLFADDDGQDRGEEYWLSEIAKEKVKEISESAKTIVNGKPYGIRDPIEAMPTDEPRRFRIIAGEHRWRAALDAKLDLVPVIIKRGITEEEASLDRLVENVVKNPLGIMQLAKALKKRLDSNISKPDLLKICGDKSSAWLSKYMSPLKMGDDVQELAEHGKFTSVEDMKAIDSLRGEVREKAIDKIHNGTDPKLVIAKFCKPKKEPKPPADKPVENEYPLQLELSEPMAKKLAKCCGLGGEFDSIEQMRAAILDVLRSE